MTEESNVDHAEFPCSKSLHTRKKLLFRPMGRTVKNWFWTDLNVSFTHPPAGVNLHALRAATRRTPSGTTIAPPCTGRNSPTADAPGRLSTGRCCGCGIWVCRVRLEWRCVPGRSTRPLLCIPRGTAVSGVRFAVGHAGVFQGGIQFSGDSGRETDAMTTQAVDTPLC